MEGYLTIVEEQIKSIHSNVINVGLVDNIDKAFAAGTDRAEMEHAAKELGVDIWEHVGNVILAMRKIAPELGLVGNVQ